jgi:XTP/dITP diphosphohydrolase
MLQIRFPSRNAFKIQEVQTILGGSDVEVVPVPINLEELQTEDTNNLVKDKAMKAFEKIGRPLFVEHTGLYLDYMNGLPGGLTQIFWDKLQADKFSQLFGSSPANSVVAKTIIGYLDGKQFFSFEGEIHGTISSEPKGNRDFQWDCVFTPDGYNQTFSELGEKKNDISMRKIALDKFAIFLRERRRS